MPLMVANQGLLMKKEKKWNFNKSENLLLIWGFFEVYELDFGLPRVFVLAYIKYYSRVTIMQIEDLVNVNRS